MKHIIKLLVLLFCAVTYASDNAYTGPYYNNSYVGKIYGGSPVAPIQKTVPTYRKQVVDKPYTGPYYNGGYVGKIYGGSPKPYTNEMQRDEE